MKRLVMRSPFNIPLPKPRREGEATLLYPFDARIAWVAACHHRTASRISWDLFSSTAVRLEPLFEELAAGPEGGRSAAGGGAPAVLGGSRIGAGFRGVAAAAARRGEERDRGGARLARGDGGGRRRYAGGRVRGAARRHAGQPPHRRRHRHRARRAASPRRAGRRRTRARCARRWRRSSSCCRGGTRGPSCWWIPWPAAARSRSKPRAWRSAPRSGGRPTCRSVTWRRSPGCRRTRPISFPGPCRASWRSTSTRSASRRWSATCARPA